MYAFRFYKYAKDVKEILKTVQSQCFFSSLQLTLLLEDIPELSLIHLLSLSLITCSETG